MKRNIRFILMLEREIRIDYDYSVQGVDWNLTVSWSTDIHIVVSAADLEILPEWINGNPFITG